MPAAFPTPESLQPQVNFWRDVYASWGRSQVAIHDNLYLGVIYEVLDLPDESRDGLTASQKETIQDRMNYWKYRLLNLESKLGAGAPLDGDDQRLAHLLAQQSEEGRNAVYGASERLRYQRGMRERFKRGLEISGMYDRSFREIFRRAGLPEDLVYLPHVESSFQANARSSAGALGIWQFTPGAARRFMNDDSVSARLDPIASAQGAARYLSYAYDKLGSWPLAVTSYNHGIGGMKRAKDLYGHNFTRIVKDYDHPLFGFASRNYYAEFLAAREIAKNPELFFPEGVQYATQADWTVSRLADADDVISAPRPIQLRTADLPIRIASARHIEPVTLTHPGYRKVSQRNASKPSRFDSKKVIRLSASSRKSIRPPTVSMRQAASAHPTATIRHAATVRPSAPAARATAVSVRTAQRRVAVRP